MDESSITVKIINEYSNIFMSLFIGLVINFYLPFSKVVITNSVFTLSILEEYKLEARILHSYQFIIMLDCYIYC